MEDQMQEDRNEAPRRKRLLTNPNPKESFVTTSPESTVSSDSISDRLAKKTRELPNLSDCHSCSVRINYTNPRERLQPLDSMWRVVLLCKKCTKRVKSSELCPYCFSAVVDEKDCFKCRDCRHSIHRDCVAKYGSELGFSVCIDCWMPDAVANSVRVRTRKSRKKSKEFCEPAAASPERKFYAPEINEEVERKVAAATQASENALRKAVAAKNAVELAKGVLSVVAGSTAAGPKVVDDSELAFMLHRAINSSPRISRYACLMSSYRGDHDGQIACYSRRRKKMRLMNLGSQDVHVPVMCYSRRRRKGGVMNSAPMDAPLMCYSRRRCYKVGEGIGEHVSVSSGGLKASNCGSESSLNGNECQERCDSKGLVTYYRFGKGVPRSSFFFKGYDCGSSMEFSGNLNTESMSDTRSFGNGIKGHKNGEERCNRYLLKYKKRSMSNLNCKASNRPLASTLDTRF